MRVVEGNKRATWRVERRDLVKRRCGCFGQTTIRIRKFRSDSGFGVLDPKRGSTPEIFGRIIHERKTSNTFLVLHRMP